MVVRVSVHVSIGASTTMVVIVSFVTGAAIFVNVFMIVRITVDKGMVGFENFLDIGKRDSRDRL